jgi:MYXO-CTERM domain-containing protein
MTFSISSARFILLSLIFSSPAYASTQGTFGDYGTITLSLLAETKDGDYAKLSDSAVETWFGAARCECGMSASTGLEITLSNPPAGAVELEVWIGSSCNEASASRGDDCGDEPVAKIDISSADSTVRIDFPAAELIAPPDGNCTDNIEKKRSVWVVYRESDEAEAVASASITAVPTDTKPPAEPDDVELIGAESRLVVRWDKKSVDADEVSYIQALCSKYTEDTDDDESKIGVKKTVAAKYVRADDVCGEGTADSFDESAPEFLCGSAAADADELAISLEGVADGTEIRVRLLVIDSVGNFTTVDPTPEYARAVPSEDFWEVYQDQGGGADGGCSATHAANSDPGGSLLLLTALGALLFLRTGKRKHGLILGVLLLLPATASAAPKTKWAFGLEVGPYYPSVDKEFTNGNTPFETVFGDNSRALVQLRVDKYFAWPFGQLGFGLGLGYTQLSAYACEEVDDGEAACSGRSAVDETKFLLLPVSAFAVYRFSLLADQDILPLVPYARLGLSASYWKVSGGDGSTSADGLSFGALGALGMVILVDEVEPQAKQNLEAEFGVSQVGLAFEVSTNELLRFGSDQLRVGATTWSAGILVGF